ncbi:hypothetical protein ES319_D13G094300v1 [Gossypium barbadense]|uniref:RING-type E3 ubiquitin transferase n=1 Tax=Gossypium barbadense TaxID=3634 RepID=A0A5J5NJ71_GOSBA|nr:hypothetical protein ES319_D13G094300v1 [Gossypium barbadense]PPD80200.1 hypothetical protein GOBAR_DD22869 [Gossypium barbadense]
MGACCCCLGIRDPEQHVSPFISLNSVIHALRSKFTGVRSNEQSDSPASNSQVSAPLDSNAAFNNIITHTARVLHSEADTTPSYEYDRIEGREDYRLNHTEHASIGNKSAGVQCESQLKFSHDKSETEVGCGYGSLEDENVCPTCLEDYIPENPRIVLQCSHTYHLGCIYKWMERSENCPICGKMMMFGEAEIGSQETPLTKDERMIFEGTFQ